MRRLTTLCLLALSVVASVVAPPAAAADAGPAAAAAKKGPKPKITRVSPMRVSVGRLITIRGRHFAPKRKRNTVIFRGSSGRTAFAKPRRARRTKLVVRVPGAVARLLAVADNRQQPTRLKLRVLARGRFSKYTKRRLSPVVTGIDAGDGGGKPLKVCRDDADHDNDLLSNDLEKQLATDPCLEDTDGDAMVDGWEYFAAKDLNVKAVPYPGRRPFPNALDPSDGSLGGAGFSAYDFDGDGLTTHEEFRAWRASGSSFVEAKVGGFDLESPLGYSDGTKYSRSNETPAVPSWRGPAFGLPAPAGFPGRYNFRPGDDGVGVWRDDERDADADGLANWLESARGPGQNTWWAGFWAQPGREVEVWPKPLNAASPDPLCRQEPGYFNQRPFAELNLADGDVDGDTLLDGEDDQDNDDYSNVTEFYELFEFDDPEDNGVCGKPWLPTIGSLVINPYNPCAPNVNARTCQDYKPFG